jgi:hypothetical protein
MIGMTVTITDKMMKADSSFGTGRINNFIRRKVHDDERKVAKGNGKVSTAKVEGIHSSWGLSKVTERLKGIENPII